MINWGALGVVSLVSLAAGVVIVVLVAWRRGGTVTTVRVPGRNGRGRPGAAGGDHVAARGWTACSGGGGGGDLTRHRYPTQRAVQVPEAPAPPAA
jgi:hypothetical protein